MGDAISAANALETMANCIMHYLRSSRGEDTCQRTDTTAAHTTRSSTAGDAHDGTQSTAQNQTLPELGDTPNSSQVASGDTSWIYDLKQHPARATQSLHSCAALRKRVGMLDAAARAERKLQAMRAVTAQQ
jgi:hypothetical protein